MTKQAVSYERTPSEELRALLAPGGFLLPICDLHRNNMEVHDGLGQDVHFRRDDRIHVYRGQTKLIDLKRMHGGRILKMRADREYMKCDRGRTFFREWRIGDPEFKKEMDNYLHNVNVDSRHTSKEGRVQMKWSRVTEPWISFDREARLAYCSKVYREKAKVFEGVNGVYDKLMKNYNSQRNKGRRSQWVEPKKTGEKVDQLAIAPDGRLVLVELKDAENGNEGEIYYSPFQLLQYVWEWHEALKNNAPKLLAQVQSLLDVRVALGLTEAPATRLTGRIRAAVCFGRDGRSEEVGRRYRCVLDICNRHLPEGVGPIETWEYGAEGPCRIPDDG